MLILQQKLKYDIKDYMKKALVSGYIGFNNFGDEAIFYALSNHLKDLNFNVSVLCNNKNEVAKKYGVLAYHYKKPFEIIKAILKNDVLISGGGSLLQNKTSNFSLIYYLFIIFLAKLFNKKVMIFAQGIEPINGKIFELLVKLILKTVDFISVRDEKTKKYLASLNLNSILVSDPAYSLAQNVEIKKNKTGLIVQLREFKGVNKELISNLAKGIKEFYQGEIKVLSLQDEIDKKICSDFVEELKKYNLDTELILTKPIDETIDLINKAKYMISTRLHGLIISNALEVKPFALSYDEKIKTITDELNLENIDINNYSKEELFEKLRKFFNNQEVKINKYRRFDWIEIDSFLAK